jgi:hypothetical protein
MSTEPENVPFDWRKDPCLGRQFFLVNRGKFPLEKLDPYINQTVAWFPDGSGIRAAAPDMDTVWQKIQDAGDDPSLYVYEDIPDPEIGFI